MATLTPDAEGPGRAATRPVSAFAGRGLLVKTATFAFDSSYPTGGEDISDLFDGFREVKAIHVSGPASRLYEPDLTAKKLKLFTAVGTEAGNGTDQSAITGVKLMAVGY